MIEKIETGTESIPCFLLSSPRAGSTLLSRILDSHSQISCPCEICVPYVVLFRRKLLRSLLKLRQICAHYEAPFPWFAPSLLLRGPARRHLAELTSAILKREKKSLLVVKDPGQTLHVERIGKLYQDVQPRCIFLHRDVRAVAHSVRRTLNRPVRRGFQVWQQTTEAMLRFQESLPAACRFTLKFEDVVADPNAALPGLVNFLGVPFEPEMVNYRRFDHADDKLNLWGNKRLVASVNKGAIQAGTSASWRQDEEVCRAYEARPDIRRLNESLGYAGDAADTRRRVA